MGLCGSSNLEEIDTDQWQPSNLNRETLIRLAPKLTGRKGEHLKSVKVEDLGIMVKRRKSTKHMRKNSSSTSAFTLSRATSIRQVKE